jgi:hypothetical protein
VSETEREKLFDDLRRILVAHSENLAITDDSPEHYCLTVPFSPKLKKGYPVAWVKTAKNYVGFHFIPVYMFPKLKQSFSDRLRARMHGKSCFNFTERDATLFKELETLTTNGFALARKAGFLCEASENSSHSNHLARARAAC